MRPLSLTAFQVDVQTIVALPITSASKTPQSDPLSASIIIIITTCNTTNTCFYHGAESVFAVSTKALYLFCCSTVGSLVAAGRSWHSRCGEWRREHLGDST